MTVGSDAWGDHQKIHRDRGAGTGAGGAEHPPRLAAVELADPRISPASRGRSARDQRTQVPAWRRLVVPSPAKEIVQITQSKQCAIAGERIDGAPAVARQVFQLADGRRRHGRRPAFTIVPLQISQPPPHPRVASPYLWGQVKALARTLPVYRAKAAAPKPQFLVAPLCPGVFPVRERLGLAVSNGRS
jgi:hypothetical protein